jgi:protein-tyrosine phosphatase
MISILFVCAGNICRSPALVGAFQKLLLEKACEGKVYVDSCATTSWFLGSQPDSRMSATAEKRGVLLEHKAKLFEEPFFQMFDFILAADTEVLKTLHSLAKTEGEREKIYLATMFSQKYPKQDIPDPYHGDAQLFEKVMDMAQDVAEGLFNHLFMQGKQSQKQG